MLMFLSTNWNKNTQDTWNTGQSNIVVGTHYTEITTTTKTTTTKLFSYIRWPRNKEKPLNWNK